MRNYFFILFLVLGFLGMCAIEPFSELTIAGKSFNLVTNLSEIETFDEVVLAAYPSKDNYNGVCCMTSENYARYDKYRATSCSANGKVWDNENDIEILTVERRRDNLFALKSVNGYLSGNGEIGIREKEITESALWQLSSSDTNNTLTCLKNNKPIYFYDVNDMFVFSNDNYTKTAPYYIYRHVPQNKCGKPDFNLPQARYPKGIAVTVSCKNAGETISYSIFKNDSAEPWETGYSAKATCVIELPEDELYADTKYVIHAKVQSYGLTGSESIATYYICTKKFLAFTKIKDISELSDDDIIIFVCPELGSAMANEDITDTFNNRFGMPVEIKNDRVDILSPENSDIAFFYAKTSANDANAFTFNDYMRRSAGKNGFLAESHNLSHVLSTIENPNDPNYTADWLIKIDNGKTLITPITDPGFSKTIVSAIYSNERCIYQLYERKSMEQLQLKYVDIYHSDKRLSSVSTIKTQSRDTEIKAVNGGIKVICEEETVVSIFSVFGCLISTERCCNNDIIPVSPGFYIATTDRGEAFKLLVQ